MEQALEKLCTYLKTHPLFYLTNDPERALGLEHLLENYHIICIDDNYLYRQLEKSNVPVLSLEHVLHQQNMTYRNSNRLLSNPLVQKYIEEHKGEQAYLLFFKIALNIEYTAKKLGLPILNTSAALNQKYENKISQWEVLHPCNIRMPETVIAKLGETTYHDLHKKFSSFVIQFERGQSGNTTYFIHNEEAFTSLQQLFSTRIAKITKYISGNYYTINACVTSQGIAMGGLCNQITGVKELTSHEGGTCGNDWSQVGLSEKARQEIKAFTITIGERMQQDGYKGLFGVDYVIDHEGKVYLLEVNARCPASIPMHTKLQLQNNQFPLLLMHILEFLSIPYEIDIQKENDEALKQIEAAQLVGKSLFPEAKILHTMGEGGVYNLSTNQKLHDGFSIQDISSGEYLFLPATIQRELNGNMEYMRLQFKQSVLADPHELKPEIKVLLSATLKEISLI